MHSSLNFLLFALPFTLAQYGNSNNSPTTTSSAAPSPTASANPSVHTVLAGNGNLAYTPNTITAAKGETVEFHFFAPEHSVAQGEFSTPCTPPANGTGFFSGDITTASGENTNVFTITINDTNPIWFYCVIPTHCQAGMSGVINPPSDGSQTLAQYQAAAGNVPNSVAPANVQGGVLGPVQAASTTSSSSPSPSKKNSGAHVGGGMKWVIFVATGAIAIAIGVLVI